MQNKNPIMESVSRACDAITVLTLRGYDVERVHEIDGISKPTIIVKYNGQCERAQREGRAVCYVYGSNQNGAYRKWQMQVSQCRVVWEGR